MFRSWLEPLPLIAILRGLRPEESVAIGTAIPDAGFRILEPHSERDWIAYGRYVDRMERRAGAKVRPRPDRGATREQGGGAGREGATIEQHAAEPSRRQV